MTKIQDNAGAMAAAALVKTADVSPAKMPTDKSDLVKAEDAPHSYQANKAPNEAELQAFLDGFAQNSAVYKLIATLNNTLKAIFRDARETEASMRIGKYISQFETALEKRDATLKAADEIKEKRLEKADMQRDMGIAQIGLGIFGGGQGGISGGAFSIVQSHMDKLQIEADDMKMRLEAKQTELDAHMNFTKQEGDLANAQISMLDSLNSTFSSLINELHSTNNATINAMAKGMI